MARIVVIDDDPWIRTLLQKLLQRQGHEVSVAATGKEGLERCLEAQTQLVITDIVMPGGDGWDIIPNLRNEVPEVRIIAISDGASANPASYLMLAERIGANRMLRKPIPKDKLLRTVRDVLM